MAESDHEHPEPESLEAFKGDPDPADSEGMDDGIQARPRIHWDPVTDAGAQGAATTDAPPAGAPPAKSAFQFDLGGALARLGDDDEELDVSGPVSEPELAEPARARVEPSVEPIAPTPPPADVRSAPDLDEQSDPDVASTTADDPLSSLRGLINDDPLPQRTPAEVEPVPEIHEATSRTIRAPASPPGSVFEDESTGAGPAPVVPGQPVSQAPVAPVEPVVPPQPVQQVPVAPVEPVQQVPVAPVEPVVAPRPVEQVPVAPVEPVVAPRPVEQVPVAPVEPVVAPRPVEQVPVAPVEPVAPGQPVSPAPALPSQPVIPSGGEGLPTLPDAPPAAPMTTEALDSAPSTPDVHALRSAELRAQRDQRKGRLFSRSLLAILGIAAVIALGLMFGRSYLFPTEWDASLTPIVDEIQEAGGVDFDHTVPLVVQPADEYTATLVDATVGSSWADDLPQWKAAGLAAGDATPESVARALAIELPVVYDPATDTIYQSDAADSESISDDLRVVLNEVYVAQLGGSDGVEAESDTIRFTGVSTPAGLARRAVDHFVAAGVAGADQSEPTGLPLPLAYELAAVNHLGEAILVGANVDPDSVSLGEPYPDSINTVLDDSPTRTASGLTAPDENPLADPIALGTDDWSLVWGAHLPATVVSQLAEIVTGDSYRPIERAGTTCFVGIFQTATEVDGGVVLSSMQRWSGAAPARSQALATLLSPQRVQIEACDPGAASTDAPDEGAVDALIGRQIDRLAR